MKVKGHKVIRHRRQFTRNMRKLVHRGNKANLDETESRGRV